MAVRLAPDRVLSCFRRAPPHRRTGTSSPGMSTSGASEDVGEEDERCSKPAGCTDGPGNGTRGPVAGPLDPVTGPLDQVAGPACRSSRPAPGASSRPISSDLRGHLQELFLLVVGGHRAYLS